MVNVMMERPGMGMQGMGATGMGMPGVMSPTTVPANVLMVPRCTFKMEKCTGGMKITCVCDDKMATSMVQNLCKMLAGGMCSCCLMLNGMVVCTCNLTMGLCKCDMTADGVCVTCTSGDKACCDMLQACCDCLSCCCENGCCCYVCFGNTPVCCGKCS